MGFNFEYMSLLTKFLFNFVFDAQILMTLTVSGVRVQKFDLILNHRVCCFFTVSFTCV